MWPLLPTWAGLSVIFVLIIVTDICYSKKPLGLASAELISPVSNGSDCHRIISNVSEINITAIGFKENDTRTTCEWIFTGNPKEKIGFRFRYFNLPPPSPLNAICETAYVQFGEVNKKGERVIHMKACGTLLPELFTSTTRLAWIEYAIIKPDTLKMMTKPAGFTASVFFYEAVTESFVRYMCGILAMAAAISFLVCIPFLQFASIQIRSKSSYRMDSLLGTTDEGFKMWYTRLHYAELLRNLKKKRIPSESLSDVTPPSPLFTPPLYRRRSPQSTWGSSGIVRIESGGNERYVGSADQEDSGQDNRKPLQNRRGLRVSREIPNYGDQGRFKDRVNEEGRELKPSGGRGGSQSSLRHKSLRTKLFNNGLTRSIRGSRSYKSVNQHNEGSVESLQGIQLQPSTLQRPSERPALAGNENTATRSLQQEKSASMDRLKKIFRNLSKPDPSLSRVPDMRCFSETRSRYRSEPYPTSQINGVHDKGLSQNQISCNGSASVGVLHLNAWDIGRNRNQSNASTNDISTAMLASPSVIGPTLSRDAKSTPVNGQSISRDVRSTSAISPLVAISPPRDLSHNSLSSVGSEQRFHTVAAGHASSTPQSRNPGCSNSNCELNLDEYLTRNLTSDALNGFASGQVDKENRVEKESEKNHLKPRVRKGKAKRVSFAARHLPNLVSISEGEGMDSRGVPELPFDSYVEGESLISPGYNSLIDSERSRNMLELDQYNTPYSQSSISIQSDNLPISMSSGSRMRQNHLQNCLQCNDGFRKPATISSYRSETGISIDSLTYVTDLSYSFSDFDTTIEPSFEDIVAGPCDFDTRSASHSIENKADDTIGERNILESAVDGQTGKNSDVTAGSNKSSVYVLLNDNFEKTAESIYSRKFSTAQSASTSASCILPEFCKHNTTI